MSRERRSKYLFSDFDKDEIKDKSNHKCVVDPEASEVLRCHHLLHIWMVHTYLDYAEPKIISDSINGILICDSMHIKLHDQVNLWSDSLNKNYAVGLYAYLEEEYYKKYPEETKPDEVCYRTLTSNLL